MNMKGVYVGDVTALATAPCPCQHHSEWICLAGMGSAMRIYDLKRRRELAVVEVLHGARVHGFATRNLVDDWLEVLVYGDRFVKVRRRCQDYAHVWFSW